jgi:hypothetical protein
MERFRSLPTWLRVFLAFLPFLMCIPLTCILLFGYQQVASWQSGTATAVEQSTRTSILSTQEARAQQEAAATATAGFETAQAELDLNSAATGTAQAVFLNSQALTQAALAIPTETPLPVDTIVAPTDTKVPVIATQRPRAFTITLRECRGFEGTVLLNEGQGQSLHAYQSISFTVPAGTYHIQVLWLNHADQNVDIQLAVDASQTLQFGDSCQ